jgi:hypothetical protein
MNISISILRGKLEKPGWEVTIKRIRGQDDISQTLRYIY